MDSTTEQRRIANARRQREYRERQAEQLDILNGLRYDSNCLEDSIKILSNQGHPLAVEIMKVVSRPDLQELADFFRCEVELFKPSRSASRNAKKSTTARKDAVVLL